MFHSYNTFLDLFNISSLFSGGIITSSTGSCFSILSLFDLAIESAILFPKDSPVLSTFFEAVFKESSVYLIIVFYIFLSMIKIHIL